jgi:glycosyltransferase involved in cell wall biosynthesis
MRIGIDAREIVGRQTGVGRWVSGLLAEWHACGATSTHRFMLYANDSIPGVPDSFVTRIVPGSHGTWWEQTQLPRAAHADGLDVFFAPQNTAPLLLRTPMAVLIHDVSFVAHPEWFRLREGIRLRWLVRAAAANARAVITVSDFSRREIADHLNVSDSRIHVIRPGVPMRAVAAPSERRPNILYVGSIFNRRHVPDLIAAAAPILRRRPDVSLDIVGDNRSYPHEDVTGAIAREQLGERITWHHFGSDQRLAELYGGARAFVFLSEYEGLGMTPLEALTAGVPPVLFDTEVAREACGDAALYVRRGRPGDITAAIEQALFDERVRSRVLAAAPAVLARFDWTRAARETLQVLERC